MDSSKLNHQRNRRSSFLSGILTLSVVLLLFAIHSIWHWTHYPHGFQQLARDFAFIDAYRESPVVNHAGTLIGMVRNTPKGIGIFVANIAGKTEQTICEANDDVQLGLPHVFGWSPDDRTFAYRWNVELRFANDKGEPEFGEIPTPYFVSFVWLSPNRCAYIDGDTNQNNRIQLAVAQKIGGRWRQTDSWPLSSSYGKPRSLLAAGTNAVVWLTTHTAWQMDLTAGTIKSLYSNPKSDITSMAYSPDLGKFLLVETAHRARNSVLSILANGSKALQPVGKFLIRDAQWIDHGKGYACLNLNGDDSSIVVHMISEGSGRTFFADGQTRDIACPDGGSRIFAFASYTNEAPGLWQCDADSGEIHQLLTP